MSPIMEWYYDKERVNFGDKRTQVTSAMRKMSWILAVPFIIMFYLSITYHTNVIRSYLNRNDRSTNTKTWLLIMCTTLQPSNDRYVVYRNTMNNWKQLGEDILPVLFLDFKYTQIKKEFEDSGWVVFPITEASAEGYPVLRHFFAVITRHYRSSYVGYANADILFGNDLKQTLQLMERYKPFILRQNEIFLSGSRYDVSNITDKDFSTLDKILTIKIEDSTRHSPMGQDYFITDAYYTWDMIPPIVIGKQRIDNWVLINAFEYEHFAVDTTEAITALHQTVDKGSWESKKWHSVGLDPKYNEKILNRLQDFIYFQTGNLECLPYALNYTVSRELVLIERPRIARFCKKQKDMIGILRKNKEAIEKKKKLAKEKALKKLINSVSTTKKPLTAPSSTTNKENIKENPVDVVKDENKNTKELKQTTNSPVKLTTITPPDNPIKQTKSTRTNSRIKQINTNHLNTPLKQKTNTPSKTPVKQATKTPSNIPSSTPLKQTTNAPQSKHVKQPEDKTNVEGNKTV